MLAYLIAAISPNMDTANAALPAYVTMLLFFSGFLIVWPQIPKYWIWLAYLDFLRYAWGSLMINHYQGTQVLSTLVPCRHWCVVAFKFVRRLLFSVHIKVAKYWIWPA